MASAFFIEQSIDKWFSVQVDRALEESGEVATYYYDSTAEGALFYVENQPNDVPLSAICRRIEIDMMQQVDLEPVPEPLEPGPYGILM